MGLRDPFSRRIATIQAFLDLPPTRVLELLRPPDLQLVVQRMMARMADDPSDPHAWVYWAPRFRSYADFLTGIVQAVDASVAAAAPELAEFDLSMPHPPTLDPGAEPWPWCQTVGSYLSEVADALPEDAGALVLLLELEAGDSPEGLGWLLGGLALATTSDRAKVVAIHGGDRLAPRSDDLASLVFEVDFAVAPEELEREVLADLDGGRLKPGDARQHRLMAGAFATAAGRFDEGERLLEQTVKEARAAGAAGEEANALYNLGNLYTRMARHEEASEALTGAASAALSVENNGLAALALTNLGVSLYQEGRGEEALASLGAARRLFEALGHRPGEAHVVDCTARVWAASDPERARTLWAEAIALYDSIRAPHLNEVRAAGRADVIEKMKRMDTALRGDG